MADKDDRLLTDDEVRNELGRYFTDEQMVMPEEIHDIVCGVIAVVRKAQDLKTAPIIRAERLHRPELREKIIKIITPIAKNYVLGYIHNLNQLDAELKKQVNFLADKLLTLIPDTASIVREIFKEIEALESWKEYGWTIEDEEDYQALKSRILSEEK